jgi:hypothetical protein
MKISEVIERNKIMHVQKLATSGHMLNEEKDKPTKQELRYFNPEYTNLVDKLEKKQIERLIKRNAQASVGVRALLAKCAKPVTSASEFERDMVIVIHKRAEETSANRHGMFAIVEDVMGEDIFLTLSEVASRPRDEKFEKVVALESPSYPNMGIYRGTKIYKVSELDLAITQGEVFSVEIEPMLLKNIVERVAMNLNPHRRVPFYGDTYGCNNFIYDVLKELE